MIPKPIVLELQGKWNRVNEFLKGPLIGRHSDFTVFDDLWEEDMITKRKLYEVMAVYGGFDEPTVVLSKKPFVHGFDEEEAIVRSGVHGLIPPDWNPQYTTIICREIGIFKSRT